MRTHVPRGKKQGPNDDEWARAEAMTGRTEGRKGPSLTPEQWALVIETDWIAADICRRIGRFKGLAREQIEDAARDGIILGAARYDPTRPSKRGDTIPFKIWAWQFARKAAIDRIVHMTRKKRDERRTVPARQETACEPTRTPELPTLAEMTRGLAEEHREAIRLRFAEDLTIAQMGERMGLSAWNTRRVLLAGMTAVRSSMAKSR